MGNWEWPTKAKNGWHRSREFVFSKTGQGMKKTLGKLPPRYSFILNPYRDVRVSKCPLCQRLTHGRKFALFIHLTKFHPTVLGKTCRYCTPCKLIVVRQDELEAELAINIGRLAPEAVGCEYLVLGTMDKKAWQKTLNRVSDLGENLKHVAQIKKYLELKVGGRVATERLRDKARCDL